jgi:hypothetical protein
MATTTNYAWATPDNTDLVKDGALAIRTLGSSIDTTTKALNPSTTLGDIEYRSATANTNTRLGIGSTGTVLTVAGGVPTWASPAGGGGGMTLLSTTSLSGSTTTINTISGSYIDLVIYVKDFYSSSSSEMNIQFNSDTTSGNYQMGVFRASGGSFDSYADNGTSFSLGGYDIAAAQNDNFAQLTIFDYSNTTTKKQVMGNSMVIRPSGAKGVCITNGGYFGSTSAITSIAIKTTAGTFSAGSVLIYGVK